MLINFFVLTLKCTESQFFQFFYFFFVKKFENHPYSQVSIKRAACLTKYVVKQAAHLIGTLSSFQVKLSYAIGQNFRVKQAARLIET